MERLSAKGPDEHVIVCGLHGVGVRIFELLHSSGTQVTVVDDDSMGRHDRLLATMGVRHIKSRAYRGEGLLEADLHHALAVVCVEVDDIHTLESALRIREIRDDLRVVVQLANPAVGGALVRVTGPGSVLDAAALAAPSFVEACLGQPVHEIRFAETLFAVVRTEVPDTDGHHSTFRAFFGDLAPVAVMPANGELVQCPGRDHMVGPGDRVAVLGTIEELLRFGLDAGKADRPLRRIGFFTRVSRQMKTAFEQGNKGLAVVVGAIALLIALSTVLLHVFYRTDNAHHLTLLSSVYFTIETIASVGFGDYSFAVQDAWMKVFGIGLIFIGVTLLSTAFALFTNILVSRRIEQSLGRREVPGMVDHVVVVGLGAVGIRVVELLVEQDQRVIVIERDSTNRYLNQARSLRVPVIIADATLPQTHRLANLHDARAVAVLTSAEMTNIETALAVRESLGARWHDVPVVVRVFDRELARMMEQSFGFQNVRSTSALAAPWFVGAALGLDVLSTFYVDQQPFLVGKVTIKEGGGLEGLAMADLSANTRVIALQRSNGGDLEHPPRRGTRFAGGDEAYVVGPYEEILRVLHHDRTLRN